MSGPCLRPSKWVLSSVFQIVEMLQPFPPSNPHHHHHHHPQPTHYANVWGREPWEETNRRNLELHNLPTNDWLVGARQVVDRCDLSPPPEAGEDITIVTALVDLGRGKSDSGSFKRPITVCVS